MSDELEGEILVSRRSLDARNGMNLTVKSTADYAGKNAVAKKVCDDQSGTVAQAVFWVEITQQHDRCTLS